MIQLTKNWFCTILILSTIWRESDVEPPWVSPAGNRKRCTTRSVTYPCQGLAGFQYPSPGWGRGVGWWQPILAGEWGYPSPQLCPSTWLEYPLPPERTCDQRLENSEGTWEQRLGVTAHCINTRSRSNDDSIRLFESG